MTKHMQALRESCEFIMPMETDEFLFWIPKASDKSYRLLREDVHAYLNSLPKNVSVVRYGAFYASSVQTTDKDYQANMYANPPKQMTKFWNQDWDKILVRADAFEQVKQWLHHVDVSYGEKITSDTLGLLHFHDTGSKREWERSMALVSLNGYGYIDFRMPENLQYLIASFYAKRHVPIYHRLEKFANKLFRKLVIESFHLLIGRLPSLQELKAIIQASSESVEKAIEYILIHLPLYRQTEVRVLSTDALVFWEPSQSFAYEIHHVANVLKWLCDK
jgi:hypothetical protein